jgi:phage gp16-like protein
METAPVSTLATIHIAKKQLGLDDETYRDFLLRETGKRSAADLNETERRKVVLAFEQRGFKRASKPPRRDRLSGPYAGKLQALWIAAHNLAIVDNPSDAALIAFVKRQTGLDHGRFLRHADDAAKVIEALKDWIRREAGDDDLFRINRDRHRIYNNPRHQVLQAQWRRLTALGRAPATDLAGWIASMSGGKTTAELTDDEWVLFMNSLGVRLRASLGA